MRAIRKYFQKYWKYKIQQTKEELNTMKIGNDIYYVGVNDHQVDLFEGQYVVPNGMSYNSYVILDDKIAVSQKSGWEKLQRFWMARNRTIL